MTSEYTPTVGELRQAYVEASGASMAQESYYAEQVAEFERGIARVKADALREAAGDIALALTEDVSTAQQDRMKFAIGYLRAKADEL